MTASETTNIARIGKLAAGIAGDARGAILARLEQNLGDDALAAAVEIERRFLALSSHGRAYVLATIRALNEIDDADRAHVAENAVRA